MATRAPDMERMSLEQLSYSGPFFTCPCVLCPIGKMLVPLMASLYVPGALDDVEKVLVDVGTRYYVEVASKKKTIADEAENMLQSKLR